MITIGIIGLGVAVTPHAKSLLEMTDRVRVAHAFSRTPARREAFAARFPFPTADDLTVVLGDPTVDAVLVLTPPNTHLEVVEQCARAGKHVLLEKPFDRNSARARRIIEVCKARGVTLGIVFQHRFRLGALRLRQLVDEGALGRLANASAYIRWWRPQRGYYDQPGRGTFAQDGGGVLITQAIHTLDLHLSLTGPVSEVSAFAQTSHLHDIEVEDIVGAVVRYANGAIGTIDATTVCYPGFKERIELVGNLGTAILTGSELRVHFQDGRELSEGAAEDVAGGADPMAFPHHFHRRLIEDFVNALETGGQPRITGEEGVKIHYLIEALLRSAAERRVIPLNE
jgi:predicted dehydrogenase